MVEWGVGRWLSPHLSAGDKSPLQVVGVTSACSLILVTEVSPEGNPRECSTEW